MRRLALVVALATLAGACSITESFDKADGVGLGPDLTWERKVFGAQPHQWATLGQRAVYEASGLGIHEDLQVPVEQLATDDQVVSIDVHEVTWGGNGGFWVSVGVGARITLFDDERNYRAYLLEIGRNNQVFPGVTSWTAVLWKVDGIGNEHVLDAAGTGGTGIQLPGTLTLRVEGSSISGLFTGTSGELSLAATDTDLTSGVVGLGGGIVVVDDESGTGRVVVDDFAAHDVDAGADSRDAAAFAAGTPGTGALSGRAA